MKRSTIWGLAITLVLGCWVGSASARLLTATGSLLVPYYEARGNLTTQIAVQHAGAQAAGVSIINVTVHDTDGGWQPKGISVWVRMSSAMSCCKTRNPHWIKTLASTFPWRGTQSTALALWA